MAEEVAEQGAPNTETQVEETPSTAETAGGDTGETHLSIAEIREKWSEETPQKEPESQEAEEPKPDEPKAEDADPAKEAETNEETPEVEEEVDDLPDFIAAAEEEAPLADPLADIDAELWDQTPKEVQAQIGDFRKKHKELLATATEYEESKDFADFGKRVIDFRDGQGMTAQDLDVGFDIVSIFHKGGEPAIAKCFEVLAHLGWKDPNTTDTAQNDAITALLGDEEQVSESAAVKIQEYLNAQTAKVTSSEDSAQAANAKLVEEARTEVGALYAKAAAMYPTVWKGDLELAVQKEVDSIVRANPTLKTAASWPTVVTMAIQNTVTARKTQRPKRVKVKTLAPKSVPQAPSSDKEETLMDKFKKKYNS